MRQTLLQVKRVYAMPHAGGLQAAIMADGVTGIRRRIPVGRFTTVMTRDAIRRL